MEDSRAVSNGEEDSNGVPNGEEDSHGVPYGVEDSNGVPNGVEDPHGVPNCPSSEDEVVLESSVQLESGVEEPSGSHTSPCLPLFSRSRGSGCRKDLGGGDTARTGLVGFIQPGVEYVGGHGAQGGDDRCRADAGEFGVGCRKGPGGAENPGRDLWPAGNFRSGAACR